MGPSTWPRPWRRSASATGAMAGGGLMTSSPSARRFDWKNLGQRVISAVVLIAVVLIAVFVDQIFFVMIAVAVALLAIEWAAMSAPRTPNRLAIAITIAVLAALFCAHLSHLPQTSYFPLAWVLIAPGALAVALVARGLRARPGD